jgi:guanylate kinase
MVLRPHLIERLNVGVHRKLTLISAPAGFGKTTLLGKWVSRSGLLGISLCDTGRSLWARKRKVSIIALGKM